MRLTISELKEIVENNGGKVTDKGYETLGNHKKAFIEVYFETSEYIPDLETVEDAENVIVDTEWDAENNGVMYEVTISER